MLIPNGTISIKTKTGGELDERGKPVRPSSIDWGDTIICRFRANKYSNRGKVNGNTFTVASYEILIESQPFTAERVKLSDKNGKDLGEFSVIEIEHLDAVGIVKITV